jgi:carbon monoxide dehydrogenase subunit G
MIKKIAIGLVAVVALILVYALTKPDTFRVERSTAIKAPPQAVHAYLTDFHKWGAWSPWEKLDPNMKRTYSGAESGKGAAYAWEGNGGVGQGRMEIKDVSPSKVTIQLDFLAPMETSNIVDFDLTPQGDTTHVVWTMSGNNNYLSKVMQVFMSMDSLVGKDFESGLSDLKAAAEKSMSPTDQPAAP